MATRRAISREGFRVTYERCAVIPAVASGNHLPDVLPAFVRAESFFVPRSAPDDCLLRSLSLYRFLREAGLGATHVIGVRRFPFQAHAWAECAGEVLLDGRAHDFTPLARIGAATLFPMHTQ
jgi:hypothetical protein